MPVLQSMQGVDDINFLQIILCFGFYFLAGYLFYGALFAAMGSAVDTEADTQQFMLPVTIPLIIGFVFANYVALNPNSDIAFWLSIIPFTSPIIMMVRLPLGEVPSWQLALSMISLILGFICTTWVAGKVYRTGILMYGKNLLGKNWVNGYSINLRNFFGVFKFVNLLFICNFTDQKKKYGYWNFTH